MPSSIAKGLESVGKVDATTKLTGSARNETRITFPTSDSFLL